VLEIQGLPAPLRAEAEYNIGLSCTWLGEYDQAEAVFNRILDTYKDDPNAMEYAQYCIVRVEIQKEKYREAIARTSGRRSIIPGLIVPAITGTGQPP